MAEKRYDSKHRVLNKGESQRSDGRYVYRTVVNGKTINCYAQSLPELREKEKEINKKIEVGIDLSKQDMTVNDFADLYLEMKSQTVQPTTLSTMHFYYDHYCRESIGGMKIATVKKSQVKNHYLSLLKRGLSFATLERLDCILAPIFETAVDDDVIFKNPVRKVCTEIKHETHATRREVDVPTPEQMKNLVAFIRDNPIFTETMKRVVIVLYGTGMRIGELTALTWDNVDFKNNKIHVVRSIGYIKENGHAKQIMKNPKTEAGCRYIPMIAAVRSALLAEKERQFAEGIPQPVLEGVTGFCFLSRRNTVFVREAVNVQIKRMQDTYNLTVKDDEKIVRFTTHAIRHAFATALCQSVSDLKAIQEIMGHKSIETTLGIYAKATEEAKEISMDAFEERTGFKL